MSDKKLFAASAAGLAALIAVSGGTFATWNDWQTFDNSAGADHLVLDIGDPATLGFSEDMMYPMPETVTTKADDGNREFEFVVASRDGEAVPNASLTMTLQNLVGTEDGCTTANSEQVDDDNCSDTTSEGDYVHDARLNINASDPVPQGEDCGTRGARQSAISLWELQGDAVNLLPAGVTLKPGEKVCIAMGLSLPNSADNASQGDSATWDFRIDLNQV